MTHITYDWVNLYFNHGQLFKRIVKKQNKMK
jgi:hypothetical protein